MPIWPVGPGSARATTRVPANADQRLFAKGNVDLKTLLVEVAQSAVRVKGTYFRDKFWRLQTRRGRNRAIMAIAHKILVRVYHVLATDGEYRELGDTYLDGLDRRRVAHGLVHRLERMGYAVRLDQPAT